QQAGRLVAGVGDAVVVELAGESMLGAEEGDQLDSVGVVKEVDGSPAVAIDAGVIGDEPDATPFELLEVVANEDVDAGENLLGGLGVRALGRRLVRRGGYFIGGRGKR